MSMVDDLEIAKRAQAAIAASTQHSSFLVQPVQSANSAAVLSDAVDLSISARDMVAQLRESKTIAEAWLQQKIKTPDLTDPDSLRTKRNLFAEINTGKSEDEDKAGQRSLSRSFTTAMNDISWLIDALGVGTFDVSRVAEVVAHRAVSDNVGVTPPISTAILQAEQSGSTAALYLEGLSVTVQKGKTIDASVERVAITSVNPSMSGSFTGIDRPMVLDVGGELQQIAAPALNEHGNEVVLTPQARATQAAKVAEILLATSMQRSDDPRHALLVVREGGKLHPEGTLKLKMDVLQPIR
ncbi:hypothetical protein [Magnetospirillum sulfuroxidans]|uniref:Uncharacterized protein n=1 Tax=Magnetospirillum sulfuroxidans TaxID=611300 RepID=A0ABS5IFM1_9PROT|nr:hypothetical protein [Magnetospirillum sulfuroxidans]MBR9972528.1 hypothetical protein [Magnetospirillum sulfuroxidans]